MAKERGSWSIQFTVEPSDSDLEHIAELIKTGFTSGEIVKDDDEGIAKYYIIILMGYALIVLTLSLIIMLKVVNV